MATPVVTENEVNLESHTEKEVGCDHVIIAFVQSDKIYTDGG